MFLSLRILRKANYVNINEGFFVWLSTLFSVIVVQTIFLCNFYHSNAIFYFSCNYWVGHRVISFVFDVRHIANKLQMSCAWMFVSSARYLITELLFFHWWVLSISLKPPCNTIWARYLLNGEIRMQSRGYSNDRHLLNRHTTLELPHATPCMNSDSYFAGKLILSSPNKREAIAKKKILPFPLSVAQNWLMKNLTLYW